MKIIYLDTEMGINGMKLYGALLGLFDDPDAQLRKLNDLGLDNLRVERSQEAQHGLAGYKIDFRWVESRSDRNPGNPGDSEEHIRRFSHSGHRRRKLPEIIELIEDLPLNGNVRRRSEAVYRDIADACAKMNDTTPEKTSLHMSDSKAVIASVIGVFMLLDKLQFDRIVSSPVVVGMGYSETSKGTVSIPIPAVQTLLDGIPYVSGKEEGELCTIAGAALLKNIVDSFEEMPSLNIEKTGNGFGRHSRHTGANCVRAYIGEEADTNTNAVVTSLEANIYSDSDDVLLKLADNLESLGAYDTYITAVTSLRGEHERVLKCICPKKTADEAAKAILGETSAMIVRRTVISAYKGDA